MANVKSAGVRELVIDRCLQERRGYTIEELMEKVNKALMFEGLNPVTSTNTIRNDLTNISNRWKVSLVKGKRRQAVVYAYSDRDFSIYYSQLTHAELRQLHAVLMNVKFLDAYQGSSLFPELCEKLEGILQLNFYQQPILLYENVPTEKELAHLHLLYDCIQARQVVLVVHTHERASPAEDTIHPYFQRQHRQQWHLLGSENKELKAVCIPIRKVVSITVDYDTEFIPNRVFDVEEYYRRLFKNTNQ